MTTIALPVRPVEETPNRPVGWRAIAKVLWLERRATILGLGALLVAFAVAAIIGEQQIAATYHSYIAAGCIHHHDQEACVTDFASRENYVSALRIAAGCFPIVAGMFLGAPLFAREYESGTFRFTWTQAAGRRRVAALSIVLVALLAAICGVAIGLLVNWVDHPYQVVGAASQWQAGNFDNAPLLLGAWSAFAAILGAALGATIGRVVASIAATMLVLGGISIGATVLFVHWLLAIGAKVTSLVPPPIGTLSGVLNQASVRGQPLPGAWFVRAWYTGAHGNVLSHAQAMAVELERGKLDTGTYEAGIKSYNSWLSTHRIVYTLAYQPQSRFWIFQLLAIAILLVISAAVVWLVVRVVNRRAA